MERTYNIPLRKEYQKAPHYRRAKKAVTALREFLVKHMKAEEIKIGRHLNEHLWDRGIKSPPHHVKVTAIKEGDLVKVELFGHKYVELTKEEVQKMREAEEKARKEAEKKAADKKAAEKKAAEKAAKAAADKTAKDKPAEKPEPAEKPAPKPVDKPLEKKTPATAEKAKPAEMPSEKPQGPSAGSMEKPPEPAK